MKLCLIATLLTSAALFAQQAPKPDSSEAEQKALAAALADGNTSGVDLIRALESFLKQYPNAAQIAEIDRVLVRAAIDNKDDRRTVQYGERVLALSQDDMLVIDRVARAYLSLGGRDNAQASLKYSRLFQQKIDKAPPPEGRDLARKQDERDRGEARALLYQSEAKIILGEKAEAETLAAKAYALTPSEETARGWAEALAQLDRDQDAIARLCRCVLDSRHTSFGSGSRLGSTQARRIVWQTSRR